MNRKRVVLTDRALRDYREIVDYYSLDASLSAARSFVVALRATFGHLSQYPASGSRCHSIAAKLQRIRSWPVSGFPYLVLYAEQEASIEVYRILHTARDIPESLTESMED